MASLVTLADAKLHLHVTGDDRNADIALKMTHASDMVMDYLKDQADEDWTTETVPGPVAAAVLIALGHLYENRGDDMKADEAAWAAIGRFLARRRDPAMA